MRRRNGSVYSSLLGSDSGTRNRPIAPGESGPCCQDSPIALPHLADQPSPQPVNRRLILIIKGYAADEAAVNGNGDGKRALVRQTGGAQSRLHAAHRRPVLRPRLPRTNLRFVPKHFSGWPTTAHWR